MLFDFPANGCLLAVRTTTQTRPEQADVLRRHLREVQLGGDATLHADGDLPSVAVERVDVPHEVLRPHVVEDHVGASTAGRVFDCFDEIDVFVVDEDVGAELRTRVEFTLAPSGHGNFRAEGAGYLDAHGADAGAAAVNQEHFAFAQRGDVHQVAPHRAGDLRERTGGHDVDTLWDAHHLADGNRDAGRVAATGEQGGDAFADAVEGQRRPDRGDGARALQADDVARPGRRRVFALALQQVCAVYRARRDVDDDLVGTGCRVGGLLPPQGVGSPGLVLRDREHRSS